MGLIIFHGVSSADLNIHVEKFPAPVFPERRLIRRKIPGKSGDVIIDRGEFENYEQPYDVYISADPGMVQEYAAKAAEWLFSPHGYARLEDSYTPDTYRLAICTGPIDIENTLNSFGRAKLTFDCLPFRRLKIGDFPVAVSSGAELVNPTAFQTLPMIDLTASGAGTITVNGTEISVKDGADRLLIDCESMDAVGPDGENRNSYITAPVLPALSPGRNRVVFSGGITSVKITPRWRRI